MKTLFKTIYLLSIFVLVGCAPRQLSKAFDEAKISRAYANSIEDAAKPQPWEIDRELVAINKENSELVWKEINGEQYLLVSSWKDVVTYYKNDQETGTYNTGKYPIWVTTAPELQDLCQQKRFGRKEGLDLRLKQLLGLPPNVEKKYFVEFWVRPQDLFRPCPDSEVSDVNCNLAFPEKTSDQYREWINQLRIASYYNPAWDKNYPWTQLGYTYDWNPKNKNNVGLSEFVIDQNKEIIVHQVYKTEAYCNNNKQ